MFFSLMKESFVFFFFLSFAQVFLASNHQWFRNFVFKIIHRFSFLHFQTLDQISKPLLGLADQGYVEVCREYTCPNLSLQAVCEGRLSHEARG